ncbi:MAG: Iron complex outerrane recepter protein [Verrucomicrobiales bacterium]|nr:Iron complex outerrane recepter protein [Verrucomicrobiales bacterium]
MGEKAKGYRKSYKKRIWAALTVLSVGAVWNTQAASTATNSVIELSLEDLLNVKVTSVSKKEEKLNDAAAAVYVLGNEEIHKSGATTVAEALRLVPGLQVAAIDANSWAVSSRGFNSQFANKLLVMIDGRTIYSPIFSGVYWDVEQLLLDDVDRIEVIRGPGATVWGANAVNGVINILSKSARDTQGSLLYGGGGNVHLVMGGARYGGKIGEDTYYRMYGTYQLNDDFLQSNKARNNDSWDLQKFGFRVDSYTKREGHLTWQADAQGGKLSDESGSTFGFNTLGRWTQTLSERSNYEVQAFYDHIYRNDFLAEVILDTADITFQHSFGVGEKNDVIWGVGYRYTDTQIGKINNPAISILDHNVPLNLASMFIQDEYKIVPDKLFFTLGTKVEHNDFTGVEVQPSGRLTFKPAENQTVWGSVSRAVRTPSEFEGRNFFSFITAAPVPGPSGGIFLPTVFGNPNVKSEELMAYELGYRIQPNHRLSIDVATFYNDYSRIISEPTKIFIPGFPFGTLAMHPENSLTAESYGGELAVTYAATEDWKISGSYSLLILNAHGNANLDAENFELNAPTHSVVLRSSYDITKQVTVNGQLRYVDNVNGIQAYVTADLGLSYRPTPNVEISVVGQNLLDDRHPEQISQLGALTTEVPRGFYGRITWKF